MTKDLNLQVNQLLPVFNKAIRKFTKLFKEAFEHEIAVQMQIEVSGTAAEIAKNKEAASNMKESLAEELGKGGGTELTEQLKAEKQEFLQKHSIKKGQAALIDNVKLGGNTVVSIPRQRTSDDEEDVEQLEHKIRSKEGKKKDKGGFKQKRFKSS